MKMLNKTAPDVEMAGVISKRMGEYEMGFIVGLLITALGLLYAIKPKIGSYMLWGRLMGKTEEPTKFMRIVVRFVGVCIILIGVGILAIGVLAHLEQMGIIG